jgi:hypothetical protein
MTGFSHDIASGVNTLSQLIKVQRSISADRFFGCFAYATQSGYRAFELGMGEDFWKNTSSRWLFGIDYGRTDPRALREIAKRANAEVRIFDGAFVVDQVGFVPRRDFHAKVAMMENSTSAVQGIVVGSGNFSFNGLRRSVEAGSASVARTKRKIDELIGPVSDAFETHWNTASALSDVIDKYEARLSEQINLKDSKPATTRRGMQKGFWIEAGYVTKNRGDDKPGNQIFASSGFHRFYGLKKINSATNLIGTVTYLTPVDKSVTINLRSNVNGMEKLTLPTPEVHGFGVYDGKILVFEPKGKRFLLTAIEPGDFESVYGHRTAKIKAMTSGRRFGVFF